VGPAIFVRHSELLGDVPAKRIGHDLLGIEGNYIKRDAVSEALNYCYARWRTDGVKIDWTLGVLWDIHWQLAQPSRRIFETPNMLFLSGYLRRPRRTKRDCCAPDRVGVGQKKLLCTCGVRLLICVWQSQFG